MRIHRSHSWIRSIRQATLGSSATLALLCGAAAHADSFDDLSGSGAVSRAALTANTLLTTGTDPGSLIDFSAYALPGGAAQPSQFFQGTLTLSNTATGGSFVEVTDTYNYTGAADTTRKHLPAFAFQFIQTGSHLFPLVRGSIASTHPEWEYVLSPGRAWNETGDGSYTRAALPFALQQKNANCVHNGVLSFLFRADGSVSRVAYQIASETCSYFKFNMVGLLSASYTPQTIAGAAAFISAYQTEVANRLPSKDLSALTTDFPSAGLDTSKLAAPNGTLAAHITALGFVTNGTHYTGACTTRYGSYPYCSGVVLPSYSTAKSAFAAVAMMRLEKKYPGAKSMLIKSLVPSCNTTAWNNVTLAHSLDMATGNYTSASYEVDETKAAALTTGGLFLSTTAAAKISYSCAAYARKVTPGTKWVYHTSDTYIAGTAMNAYLKGIEGSGKDIHTDLLGGEVWGPIKTSPTSLYTRRTLDTTAQPFTGWGLIFLPDDFAKVSGFLGIARGAANGSQILDSTELDKALQRNAADRGLTLPSPYTDYRYQNGFWAYNVKTALGCSNDAFIPFMSGSGGITVLMMPNDTTYYLVSDNNTYYFLDAIVQSHKIRPICT